MMLLLVCMLMGGANSVFAEDVYVKVTSPSELVEGEDYILAEVSGSTKYLATGTSLSSSKFNTETSGFSVSADGNTITVTTASPATLTLGKSGDYYLFTFAGKYLGYNSSTNFRNNQTGYSADNEKWSIGDDMIIYNKQTSTRYIGQNSKIGPYADLSKYPAAFLYKKNNKKDIGSFSTIADMNLSLNDMPEFDPAAAFTKDANATGDVTFTVTPGDGESEVAYYEGGCILAIGEGSQEFTVTATPAAADEASYEAVSTTFTVNVTDSRTAVGTITAINPSTVYVGGTGEFTLTQSMSEAVTYEWESSDVSKLVLADEIYEAKAIGDVNVSVTAKPSTSAYKSVTAVFPVTVTYKYEAPAISKSSGEGNTFTASTTVTIGAVSGATVYYTTDGTEPEATSTAYSAPFDITATTTVKAIAIDGEGLVSPVATATYTMVNPEKSTIDLRGKTTSLTFSDFSKIGSGYTTAIQGAFPGSDDVDYTGWSKTDCMYFSSNHSVMQMKSSSGVLNSPVIYSDHGVIITVKYGASALKLQIKDKDGYVVASETGDKVGSNSNYSGNVSTSSTETQCTFTLSAGSNAGYVESIEIAPIVPKNVATPSFSVASGTYNEVKTVELACETEGATIYYTTNGNVPTNESTEYTAAITVDETMTIKAIAYKNGEASDVASATYTIELPLTTIAEVKALSSGDTFYLDLTGAQIVYFDGSKNMYVRDASGAILFYNAAGFSTSLTTGDILNGVVSGKYSPFNGLPEVTNSDIAGLTATSNATVVAKTIAGTTDAIAANLCDLVKIENTDIVLNSSNYYVGESSDIQLYDGLHIGVSFDEGNADVQGIATVYNTTYELFPRYESDIVYLDNAVAVEIGTAGMATFSCDKALDFTGVDAIAAYTATVTTEGKITFTRIYEVPANTGLLLRNAQGEDKGAVAAVNVPVIASAAAVAENALVAVDTEIAQLATETTGYVNYILNKVNGNLGFYKANNQKVAAGKAYLQVSATTARASFAISFDDETTGIATVENASVLNENYYNLNGQRIVAPQKGLYIVNGKKVVLK